MGIRDWFKRRNDKNDIPTGRISQPSSSLFKTLSPYRSRTTSILNDLRRYKEETSAIDFARKTVPDVSMAVWNFVRLANQGHKMYFYDTKEKEKRLTEIEEEWRSFAERVNSISNSGLDGLMDQIHTSAMTRGAMAFEVEVNEDRTDVVEIHPIIPQTITWEIEERNGRKVWIPYQQQFTKRVSLEKGKANFFWAPVDPDIDDPRGNLILSPALQAIDFQLQILTDLQAVLHRQGYPRNDIKILLERIMQYMPPEIKASPKKQKQWLREKWNEIVESLNNIEPDSDYIHFDDIEVDMTEGANAGRGLDVRAIDDLVSVQVLNGLKQMGIVSNRVGGTGETESWGSITFKIFCDGISSVQRGSKRLMEQAARLWLRVRGYQAVPHFEHNPVNWENEEQIYRVKLMKQEFYVIAQLMGWIDGDVAAQETVGADGAIGDPSMDNIRVSFTRGGGDDKTNDGKDRLRKSYGVLRMREKTGS